MCSSGDIKFEHLPERSGRMLRKGSNMGLDAFPKLLELVHISYHPLYYPKYDFLDSCPNPVFIRF